MKNQIPAKILWASTLNLFVAAALAAPFEVSTDGQLSKEQTAWLRDHNRQVNDQLQASPNRAFLTEWFRGDFSDHAISQYGLPNGMTLKLVDRGLNKSMDIVLEKPGHEPETLFTNFSLGRNNSARLLDLTLSPGSRFALFKAYRHGSLDDFEIFVLDLQSRQLVVSELKTNSNVPPAWRTSDRFTFQNEGKIQEYSLGAIPGIREMRMAGVQSSKGFVLTFKEGSTRITDPVNSRSILVKGEVGQVLGQFQDKLYLSGQNKEGRVTTYWVPAPRAGSSEMVTAKMVIPAPEFTVRNVSLEGEQIFFQLARGLEEKLRIYDLNGKMMLEVRIPAWGTLTKASWQKPGETLNVTLSSPLNESQDFVYNVRSGAFQDSRMEEQMMAYAGVPYETRIVQIPSRDGTLIPTRITKRKDIPLNGEAPSFMTVYGGFGIGMLSYRLYNRMNREFMRHGGLIVIPAIRGGNERGAQWHTQAMGENKYRVIEDVVAVAQFLARNQYSRPERIILTGTSNGGMVTASATLSSPGSIGFTIPINGVQNLLQAEAWDARFGGWAYEWGSAKNPRFQQSLSQISPTELAAKATSIPKMLILTGLEDSRVNTAHSSELALRLQARGATNVYLYSLRNSGHWMAAPAYQNAIAWRTNVVMWTMIYDHLGWNLEKGQVGARTQTGLTRR